mgnify:CR=1 FL=1
MSAGGNGGTGGAGFGLCGAPGVGGSGFQFGGGFGGGSSGAVSGYYSSSSARVYNAGSGDPRPPIGTATPFVAPTGATPHMVPEVIVPWGVLAHGGGRGPGGAGGACYDTGAGDTQEYAITELPEMPIQGAQSGFCPWRCTHWEYRIYKSERRRRREWYSRLSWW